MGFVKLSDSILDSSIWVNGDDTRLFITALLMARPHVLAAPAEALHPHTREPVGLTIPAGEYGLAYSTVAAIISRSLLDRAAGEAAFVRLCEPDALSRDGAFDGRRLAVISGGILALRYMEFRNRSDLSTARVRVHRSRTRNAHETFQEPFRAHGETQQWNGLKPPETQAEAEAEAEIRKTISIDTSSQPETLSPSQCHSAAFRDENAAHNPGRNGKQRRGSKMVPETWQPGARLLARIAEENIPAHLARGGTTVELELERFRSCTFATPRQDWDRTAWNWLLTECKKINAEEARDERRQKTRPSR